MFTAIQNNDPQMFDLLKAEEDRQRDGLTLIPSENHTSVSVLEALSSVLSDKYAEVIRANAITRAMKLPTKSSRWRATEPRRFLEFRTPTFNHIPAVLRI